MFSHLFVLYLIVIIIGICVCYCIEFLECLYILSLASLMTISVKVILKVLLLE